MSDKDQVVIFAGGTGGAKLARGMLDVVGAEHLTVVANTGDDIEIYGGYVSPDPDLVSFWLADRINERGWGLDGDTFKVMDGLRALGVEVWFNLGDQDLAIALQRARRLRQGARLTQAHAELCAALGVGSRVLPMSDRPVRTRVLSAGRWWTLQEFMIRRKDDWRIDGVQFHGARGSGASPEVLAAIRAAGAIIIGPSNPVISIGPILAIPEIRTALQETGAPVVAVSPLVGGQVLKGPTAEFMRWRGVPVSAAGLAELYTGLIQGVVTDEQSDGQLPSLRTGLLMDGPGARARLAGQTLEFARSLPAAHAGTRVSTRNR
ncbi:MAG: 2-phospho-L-lactate transferase [Solirubrobacteraceae bacterium]